MLSCCSSFECAADQQFNQHKVAQELKRYRQKGPGPTTRMLVEGIAQSGALSGSVLDVGSGIGALTFALLERGATAQSPVSRAAGCHGRRHQHRLRRRGIRRLHAAGLLGVHRRQNAPVLDVRRQAPGRVGRRTPCDSCHAPRAPPRRAEKKSSHGLGSGNR